ncbi:MAG: MGMT family protein [Deltaproteobacteria bacterium]|nr:MGMT family protein [Deltaproteobacteria bacterium]
MSRVRPPGIRDRIYSIVRRIPRGRVATYGQIARLAGIGGHARQVGYALHDLDEGSAVPWQRVVNARGECSPRAEPGGDDLQRFILEREGIVFDHRGRLDLERYAWRPRQGTTLTAAREPETPRRFDRAVRASLGSRSDRRRARSRGDCPSGRRAARIRRRSALARRPLPWR